MGARGDRGGCCAGDCAVETPMTLPPMGSMNSPWDDRAAVPPDPVRSPSLFTGTRRWSAFAFVRSSAAPVTSAERRLPPP